MMMMKYYINNRKRAFSFGTTRRRSSSFQEKEVQTELLVDALLSRRECTTASKHETGEALRNQP